MDCRRNYYAACCNTNFIISSSKASFLLLTNCITKVFTAGNIFTFTNAVIFFALKRQIYFKRGTFSSQTQEIGVWRNLNKEISILISSSKFLIKLLKK